jgi:hypothetical protein
MDMGPGYFKGAFESLTEFSGIFLFVICPNIVIHEKRVMFKSDMTLIRHSYNENNLITYYVLRDKSYQRCPYYS